MANKRTTTKNKNKNKTKQKTTKKQPTTNKQKTKQNKKTKTKTKQKKQKKKEEEEEKPPKQQQQQQSFAGNAVLYLGSSRMCGGVQRIKFFLEVTWTYSCEDAMTDNTNSAPASGRPRLSTHRPSSRKAGCSSYCLPDKSKTPAVFGHSKTWHTLPSSHHYFTSGRTHLFIFSRDFVQSRCGKIKK